MSIAFGPSFPSMIIAIFEVEIVKCNNTKRQGVPARYNWEVDVRTLALTREAAGRPRD